jgi:protein disulfide-isomerase
MNSKLMKHKGFALLTVLLAGLAVAAYAAAPKLGSGCGSGCSSCAAGAPGHAGKAEAKAKAPENPHAKLVVTLDGMLKDLDVAESAASQGKRLEALNAIEKVKKVLKGMRDRAHTAANPPVVKGWTEDLDKAKEYAARTKRPILLDFSGSDWCGWCIKLHDEVFSKDDFKAYADKNLVLVEIDFPRRKAQPADIKARNSKLAAKHGVRGFPTILILDPSGEKVLGKTGYVRGGPSAFIAEVKKITGKK